MNKRIVVAGAGTADCRGGFLAKNGYAVEVYEKRKKRNSGTTGMIPSAGYPVYAGIEEYDKADFHPRKFHLYAPALKPRLLRRPAG